MPTAAGWVNHPKLFQPKFLDSRIERPLKDELLDKLIQAVKDIDPAAMVYFSEHQPYKDFDKKLQKLAKAILAKEVAEENWPQNPLHTAPAVVKAIQKKHKLGEDGAVLYAQLLALPEPTTDQWTGMPSPVGPGSWKVRFWISSANNPPS